MTKLSDSTFGSTVTWSTTFIFLKMQHNKKTVWLHVQKETFFGRSMNQQNNLYKYMSSNSWLSGEPHLKVASSDVSCDIISCCCGLLGSLDSMCTHIGAAAATADQRVPPASCADASHLQGRVAISLWGCPHPWAQCTASYWVRIPSTRPSPTPAILRLAAGHAQHPPSQHGDECRSQTDVQTLPQLKLHTGW